jgi:NADH dehydrogenase/NADH:ubiquinone oxidoreductase subunit G
MFATHEREINSAFDIVLPMSLIAEKSGSLTNIVGSVQNFSPALDAPGDCKPAWQFLLELAKKMSINPDFYNQFSSIESIREVMKQENSFFREVH